MGERGSGATGAYWTGSTRRESGNGGRRVRKGAGSYGRRGHGGEHKPRMMAGVDIRSGMSIGASASGLYVGGASCAYWTGSTRRESGNGGRRVRVGSAGMLRGFPAVPPNHPAGCLPTKRPQMPAHVKSGGIPLSAHHATDLTPQSARRQSGRQTPAQIDTTCPLRSPRHQTNLVG